jgi:uncharacterized protein (TIGR03382 family)
MSTSVGSAFADTIGIAVLTSAGIAIGVAALLAAVIVWRRRAR